MKNPYKNLSPAKQYALTGAYVVGGLLVLRWLIQPKVVIKGGARLEGRHLRGDSLGANNASVVSSWANGQYGQSNSMRSDGKNLWSYALLIGTTRNGKKIVYDYTGPNKVSATTGKHVNLAKQYASAVLAP